MEQKSNRSRLIGLIHVQKTSAGLDDSTYRIIVSGATGKESCSDCSMQELRAVFNDLNTVLEKQNKKTFRFYYKKEQPTLLDAVSARSRKILGSGWKDRLDSFVQTRFKKESYTKCGENELRSIMAFLSKTERREHEKK
ncbi:MAG TPA: hypothetical protein DCP61_07270 [Treponema sp.]|nr:hypothetical protein [Treponema sp.]